MSGESFGVPPCTCTRLPDRDGRPHWEIDPDCTVHGRDA